jgi:hypothetical protein
MAAVAGKAGSIGTAAGPHGTDTARITRSTPRRTWGHDRGRLTEASQGRVAALLTPG